MRTVSATVVATCGGTAALVLATLLTPATASAAEIVLRNVWMRPAAAGSAAARVYLDIESDVAIDLVGAASPIAKKVEIVRTGTIGDPATEKVVEIYPVAARTQARLAYRGDHLRFVTLTGNAFNGTPVEVTLTFRDAQGRRTEVSTPVLVRGLFATPPDQPAAEGKAGPVSEPGGSPPAGDMPAR